MAPSPGASTLNSRRLAVSMAVALLLPGLLLRAQQSPGNAVGQPGLPGTIAASPPPAPPSSAVTPLGGVHALQGLPVRDIQFRGLAADARVQEELRQLVVQGVNQPLDRQKIGRSLRALWATGRFADLQVEAQRDRQNQVALVFVATENLFIGSITVDGAPKRPSSSQLINATKLELGQWFTVSSLEAAMAQMKALLAENGYYEASITESEERHPEVQQINLFFQVDPGPQARIGKIIVTGSPDISDADVRRIAKMHPGDAVTAPRVTRGLQRLRKYYSKRQRLEAQIAIAEKRYHQENNTLDYVFRIVPGPVVDIRVAGAPLSGGKLRRFVPVYEEHAVDDDLLNEGRRNIRDYLQTQGYFDAEVDFTRQGAPQSPRVDIVYQIERGSKHDLTDLVIEGNRYFSTDLIRERMAVQPASLLLRHGRFSQELLNRDVQSIRELYVNNGFEQVRVTGNFQDNYQGVQGRMAVFIHVDEGPQTLVGTLNIVGNQAIPDDDLTPLLNIMPGQPFSQANVAQDRDSVMSYYFNHGFPDVIMNAAAAPAPGDPTRMNVTYTIEEGPRVFVDRILLSGLTNTRRGVVQRQFQIHSGQPLSQSQMLDTQRRLYDLGVFNAVDMAVQNPEGQARYKDLFFQFEEAKRWTFNYGFGIEIQTGAYGPAGTPQGKTGASPRVSLDITRINFGGRAHTLNFATHVGRLEQRGLISYDAPRFLTNENLRLTLSAFYDNSVDVRTFTSERLEGSVQLEQIVSKASRLLYRFTYRRVRATDIVVTQNLIPLFSRPVRVGMPSLTYIRDRRDDPIDTHNGNYNTFDTGVASGVFGSEAAFGRFLGQNATYHPFHGKRWVFARSLRLGLAEPFGDTSALPLPERFFAGGGNSLRGFAINQAGPRDLKTGLPLGGNAMVINNLELRTPPVPMPFVGNSVGFVLFHDAGNVFNSASEMFNSLLKWNQRNRSACKQLTAASTPQQAAAACTFNYISHALGAGIRYKTPIGPVRLDFGYNLNPPTFPVFPDQSNNFTPFHLQTLTHFNFVFSIGQTF